MAQDHFSFFTRVVGWRNAPFVHSASRGGRVDDGDMIPFAMRRAALLGLLASAHHGSGLCIKCHASFRRAAPLNAPGAYSYSLSLILSFTLSRSCSLFLSCLLSLSLLTLSISQSIQEAQGHLVYRTHNRTQAHIQHTCKEIHSELDAWHFSGLLIRLRFQG